ncbi:hypothetical protein ADL05_18530 [Nocardiopsis sp. NRRL B-16309]|nr:hypothetical protein ADL05_18530 [Nocardiopsis sp. NRRL B-16309]
MLSDALSTDAIARAQQVVVPAVAASERTLDFAALDRLAHDLPGPAHLRWQRAAIAATILLCGRLHGRTTPGRAAGDPAPLEDSAPLAEQTTHLVTTWCDHGPGGLRHLMRTVDPYRARALTLVLIVANVRTRRPRLNDAAFDAWARQVISHASGLRPPAWLKLAGDLLFGVRGLMGWLAVIVLVAVPPAATYALTSGTPDVRLGWSLTSLAVAVAVCALTHRALTRAH